MAPRVTIGLPVRNGQDHIGRAIASVLAQNYASFELVICDNHSDDSTADVVRSYAAKDSRVVFHQNATNIGQITNMNRVFELGSGEYFRWMGHDDWLEPDYLSKCVELLERREDLIAVSTYIRYFDDDGNHFYAEYRGERLESEEAHRRFARMLWFLRSDYRFCDSHYALYRRSALEKTHLLRSIYAADRLLAAELALVGPYGHISECLSHRRRVPSTYDDMGVLHRRSNPDLDEELQPSLRQLCANFNALVAAAPLTPSQKTACRYEIARYFLAQEAAAVVKTARRAARRVPGYRRVKPAVRR